MNYNHPKLISALAAEYVLGTLRGKARDRFEALKFGNDGIQNEVAYWESQLNIMSMHLAPVNPSSVVWEKIQTQLGFSQAKPMTEDREDTVISVDFAKESKVDNWKWASGLAMAASLFMAVLLFNNVYTNKNMPVISVAVITNEDAKMLWSFDVLKDDIKVQTTSLVPRLANNDYQLWIVPASGSAPISIGVMPQVKELRLQKPKIFDEIEIAALAVSKEPKGGSPTGLPTEVLFAAELATL